MKITVPTIKIADDEGFSSDKDIFSRKEFGDRLINLIENSNEELVLAIDAQWGEGKSTFMQMWRGHIYHHRESKVRSIYFDAFSNDYNKDPFIALSVEIFDIIKDESKEKKDKFIKKAGDVAKSMARGALKIGVRAASSGILDGTVVDSVEENISNLLTDQVDILIADRFNNANSDKQALINFRKYLEKFALDHGGGQPIVFIIDELDRCRPDFALDLIEQIKHLFSVPGIVFVLVMNRSQLEGSIKLRYGSDELSSVKYLQKFINLWLTLPRRSETYSDDGIIYTKYLVDYMVEDGEKINNTEAIGLLKEVVKYYKLSFRDIERVLTYFALIHNMSKETKFNLSYQIIVSFICYLKVVHPQLVQKIADGKISSKELIEKTGLDEFDNEVDYQYLPYLKKYLIFELATDEVRNEIMKEKTLVLDNYGRAQKDVMITVCKWLADIQRQN